MAESAVPLTQSERAVMDIVRRHQPIARSAVTQHISLTQQQVHRLSEVLVEKKLLANGDAVIKGRGKPSPQLVLNDEATYSLGVSIRTDRVELVSISLSGERLNQAVLEAAPNDREAVLSELRALSHAWHGANPQKRAPLGIGIGVQGYRLQGSSDFRTPAPTDQWSRIPVEGIVQDALEMPAYAENNATCAAIAELYQAKNTQHRSIVCLTFNYGFGAGIIWNGQVITGGFGNAGEVSRLFKQDTMRHRPALGELVSRLQDHNVPVKDVTDLLQQFDPRWPGVSEWLSEVSDHLNLTISAVRAVVDPEVIYFGGEAPAALRQMLIDTCRRPEDNRYGEQQPFPDLLESRFDTDATAVGAAMLPARMQLFEASH